MKTFYSLIKISPNTFADDSLTLGLLLSDENGFRFKFSNRRKSTLKSLLRDKAFVVDFLERELTSRLKELNDEIATSKSELFDLERMFSSDYFEYLSRYSNGVLKFSPPRHLSESIDDFKFNELYTIMIGEESAEDDSNNGLKRELSQKVDRLLVKRVVDKVHTRHTFTSKNVPALISKFEVDCIGRNGALVGAKSLSFGFQKDTIQKNVSSFVNIIAHLSDRFDKRISQNEFFLISDEPPKKMRQNHEIWKSLRKERFFKIIPSDEAGRVAEIIETSEASKFLENF